MKEILLETLTPIILDSEQKEKLNYANYEEILNSVIGNPQFCNIALTGTYGAGKSTIMNTYEKEHSKIKAIHISLAKLNDEETDNVQAKLINQIIHQIDFKLIPQTRFKIKNIVSKMNIIMTAVLLFVFIVSLVYLWVVPKLQMKSNNGLNIYEILWMYKENIVILAFALTSLLVLLLRVVNMQFNRPLIKSIHVDKSQIELVDDEKESEEQSEKFDKYMDEIIYLFEKSKVNMLIIEDLDRMDNVKIFYEFRQLNYLVNKRLEQNKKKEKIQFVYMVRDELFKNNEERTKFFDVIIPVVPVMDNSNSYELLKKMMGNEWLDILDKSYLKTICLYIRDYRLLKNIFNEFRVYHEQLRIEEHKYDPMKLFVIITYKNIWPEDFADLQRGKGNVFTALNSIEELRKIQTDKLEEEITALSKDIQKIKEELLNDIDELDSVYFNGYVNSINNTSGYYIIDGTKEHSFATRKDFIHALKESDNVRWYRMGYSNEPILKKDIEAAFENLSNIDEYVIRKQRMLECCENGTARLEQKIDEKRMEQIEVQNAGFRKLTEKGTPKKISDLFICDKKLILIFLQDEMITTDYASYMTYFYPYSISNEELKYLNKVYSRIADEEQENVKIKNPNLVIEHLKNYDWNSVALPNKSLYIYLLKIGGERLNKAIDNLKKHSNIRFAVTMIKELENTEELKTWVNSLLEIWNDFFTEFINFDFEIQQNKISVLFSIITCAELNKIPTKILVDYLGTIEKELIEGNETSVFNVLNKINYKFKNIDYLPEDLLNNVYSFDMYVISKENVEFMMKRNYTLNNDNELHERNYSLLNENSESSLARYVCNSLEDYLNDVYIPHYAEFSKEEDSIIKILNNDELSELCRIQLVEKMGIEIQVIDKIKNSTIKVAIVENFKMAFVNTNVLSVWSETEEISVKLQDFLKEKYKNGRCELSFAFTKKYFNENNDYHPKSVKFIEQLLEIKGLKEGYRNLINDVNIQYPYFPSINWTQEQLEYVVETKIIKMTEKNLVEMRKKDDELLFKWISTKIKEYLNLMKKETLRSNSELQKLITLEMIQDKERIECVQICTEEIAIIDKYNTSVVESIFEKQLFDGNFIPVIRRYNSNRYGKAFSRKIGEYMITYISDVINMKYALPIELLKHIVKSTNVKNSDKKRLLAAQVGFLDLVTIKECLLLCDEKEFLSVFEGQYPKIDATEDNRVLIESLIKQKILSSYRAVNEQYIIYPKKKNKKEK